MTPALSDAQLARESLLSGNAEAEDEGVRGAVAVQVERAAVALERTVASAPDPEAGSMATTAAASLRGLAFAIEADRLLRHGTSSPSGVQLAQADDARGPGAPNCRRPWSGCRPASGRAPPRTARRLTAPPARVPSTSPPGQRSTGR